MIQPQFGLRVFGLSKSFPGITALDNVSLEVWPGQVLALVGANGAGKSTLIKILTGYYPDYHGRVEIDGQPVQLSTPMAASSCGIAAVYQEVDTVLFPQLSVAENVMIDALRRGSVRLSWSLLRQEAQAALAPFDPNLDVTRRVEALALHEKQLIVIARAILRRARYVIFDEPTTALSFREVERLFQVIRTLKAQGVGVVYISHRLDEVQDIADRVAVLRAGRKVKEFDRRPFDMAKVGEAMLGQAMVDLYPSKRQRGFGKVVLEARNLTRAGVLNGVALQAREGEILGIAGLVGAGKSELLRALFGADPLDAGEILLDERPLKRLTPKRAVASGIFLVPEERRKQGLLMEESVCNNVALPFLKDISSIFGFLQTAREVAHARPLIERVGLVPSNPDMVVKNLSGGNQQKVVIAKWFGRAARVVLFDEPTQGIDIGAKREVYGLVQRLAQRAAVIYASSEIDEVAAIADRVLVMRDGRIVAELIGGDIDRNKILEYATGVRSPQY